MRVEPFDFRQPPPGGLEGRVAGWLTDACRATPLAWAKLLWVRRGKITTGRRQRPMAAKETQRWQGGITAAETVLAGAELSVLLGDPLCDWAIPAEVRPSIANRLTAMARVFMSCTSLSCRLGQQGRCHA